jgi:DNA-binding response OmpR family regulator
MTSPVTILLLDDEPLLRRASALLLSNRGASVTTAATPDEAVALASARLYDVAILDLSEGGARAADVVERMRAAGAAPRRVITVCDAPPDPRAASVLGEVLQKPYPFDQLVRAVFGAGGRSRTYSGVFPRAHQAAHRDRRTSAPRAPSHVDGAERAHACPERVTQRAPRRAARAARGRG